MIKPTDYIDFNGPTWRGIKMWAEDKRNTKVSMLIGADTHDKSNQIRGAIQLLSELLALEQAANNQGR